MELITRIEGKLDTITEKLSAVETRLEVAITNQVNTKENIDENVAELKEEIKNLQLSLKEVKADIKALEHWRSYVVGAIAVITIIGGIAWRYIEKKFL